MTTDWLPLRIESCFDSYPADAPLFVEQYCRAAKLKGRRMAYGLLLIFRSADAEVSSRQEQTFKNPVYAGGSFVLLSPRDSLAKFVWLDKPVEWV